MARHNAMEENFEEISVLGKPALFHNMRINQNTVPKELYLYEVRHDDEGWGNPVQIAKGIMVNHYGSIITREPINLPQEGYLDIDPEKDWNFAGGCRTVKEFQEKYPPMEKRKMDRKNRRKTIGKNERYIRVENAKRENDTIESEVTTIEIFLPYGTDSPGQPENPERKGSVSD